MKRYNKSGEVEMVTAKMVFEFIQYDGYKHTNRFSSYIVADNDEELRYRVDCGEIGSFEVTMRSGEEEFDTKLNDWIFIEGTIYSYHSCSTTFAGYPYLPIEKAYDYIINS